MAYEAELVAGGEVEGFGGQQEEDTGKGIALARSCLDGDDEISLEPSDDAIYKEWNWTNQSAFDGEVIEFLTWT